jgi:hypothetical protein
MPSEGRFVVWSSFLLSTLTIDRLFDWHKTTRDPDFCQAHFSFFYQRGFRIFYSRAAFLACIFFDVDIRKRVSERTIAPTRNYGGACNLLLFLSTCSPGGGEKIKHPRKRTKHSLACKAVES